MGCAGNFRLAVGNALGIIHDLKLRSLFPDRPCKVEFYKPEDEGYTETCNELDQHVFNNLLGVTPDQKKLLKWDILECMEMACLEVEKDLNPVLDGEALLFNATSEFHRICVYLVFPVDKRAIVVGLATRT